MPIITRGAAPRRSLGPLPRRKPLPGAVGPFARRTAAGVVGTGVLLGSLATLAVPAQATTFAAQPSGRATAARTGDEARKGLPRHDHRDASSSSGADEGRGSVGTSGRRTGSAAGSSSGGSSSGSSSGGSNTPSVSTDDGGSGSSTSGVTGADGLQPATVAVLDDIRARFPQITEIGGVRPDSLPDHPSGRALDLMIPAYDSASGRALGDEVAAYLQQNAGRLDVTYVIWRQQIWSQARSSEGWRAMADRGGTTANHMDHVHVTVN